MRVNLFQLILFFIQINYCFPYKESEDKCLNRIYRECTHETTFTEEEVENVRLYLQKRFAKTRPIRKPCERLRVRKDVKCLTKEEFEEFVDAVKQLKRNGIFDDLSQLHHEQWAAVHKYGVGLPWHRYFINIFEKELMKVNPRVTLPYWNYFDDFAEPEKSIIWELFGHSGTPENDYCVVDGPFANWTIEHPTHQCLRRRWRPDFTLNPWEGPEWATSLIQMGIDFPLLIKELHLIANWSTIATIPRNIKDVLVMLRTLNPTTKPWSQFALGMAYVAHFKTHLSVGGFGGDMSETYSTNDPLFYVFHAVSGDMSVLSYQLSDDRNLVPQSYNLGVKYDFDLKRTAVADIRTDVLPDFPEVTAKETFEVGFGELCYIHSQYIQPINELIRGERRPLPEAYHRLKASLPKQLFAMFYPKFHYYPGKVTYFDYILSDVSKCNKECHPMPVALNYLDTDEGVVAWHHFKNDLDMDLTFTISSLEKTYLKFMAYLKHYKYCSPYVL